MARIETDPNYSAPTFPRATAATDLFKKGDVQLLAEAVSTHVHDGVHGLKIVAASLPSGLITSAMIADGGIATIDLADGSVTAPKIAAGAASSNIGALSGALSGTLPAPSLAAGAALANLGNGSISQVASGGFGGPISTTSASLVGTGDSQSANLAGERVLVSALASINIPASASVQMSLREVTSGSVMPFPVSIQNGTAGTRTATFSLLWLYTAPATLTARAFETMWAVTSGTATQGTAPGGGVRTISLLMLSK